MFSNPSSLTDGAALLSGAGLAMAWIGTQIVDLERASDGQSALAVAHDAPPGPFRPGVPPRGVVENQPGGGRASARSSAMASWRAWSRKSRATN